MPNCHNFFYLLCYRESANQTWDLQEASNKLEGVYACIATNSEGSNRADTFLDVTGKLFCQPSN